MGLAIFVPDINFSGKGNVTLVGDTVPISIKIDAQNSYSASSALLSVTYTPINAALRGITWSIVSGGEYASIDGNGKLTINQNASGASIKVRAVSQADGSVSDEKTITVTYVNPVTVLEKVTIHDNPTINTGIRLVDDADTIEIQYKVIDASGHIGMLWSDIEEHSSCYIADSAFLISVFGADRDDSHVQATGERHTYRIPTVIGEEYTDVYSMSSFTRNNDVVAKYGNQSVGDGFTPSGDIHILHPLYEYAFAGIEINYFKFKRNGVVTHAFMPAVKNGVYGFYDASTDTFITNTGESGTITA